MGFGRVGRSLFRLMHGLREVEIRAVADSAEAETLEYLLRFDTIQGRFPDDVSIEDGEISLLGRKIPFVPGGEPGSVPWGELGVDIVIEATAHSRSRAELNGHLKAGARRVILCTPPLDEPDLTVLVGVNEGDIRQEHKVISNGSATAHCAAPLLEVLEASFGIERVFLNSVHAYSQHHTLADVPSEDMRSGRAAAENIIPTASNSASVLLSVMPWLDGKIRANTMIVPVDNGSMIDLTCWHKTEPSVEGVRYAMREASRSGRWQGVFDYEDDPIVSTDIEGTSFSSTFDGPATMTLGKMSKTLAWFDNHWGYAGRVVDLAYLLGEQEGLL